MEAAIYGAVGALLTNLFVAIWVVFSGVTPPLRVAIGAAMAVVFAALCGFLLEALFSPDGGGGRILLLATAGAVGFAVTMSGWVAHAQSTRS